MYKILLNDYEYRQKQILMENAELKKVLQQMKKEMISLLSPQKQKPRERADDSTGTVSGAFLSCGLQGADRAAETLDGCSQWGHSWYFGQTLCCANSSSVTTKKMSVHVFRRVLGNDGDYFLRT